MIDTKTGGPAFPFGTGQMQYFGMSLCDYFAINARENEVYLALVLLLDGTGITPSNASLAQRATARYQVADAMLKARMES